MRTAGSRAAAVGTRRRTVAALAAVGLVFAASAVALPWHVARAADAPEAYVFDVNNNTVFSLDTVTRSWVGAKLKTKGGRKLAMSQDGKTAVLYREFKDPQDATKVTKDFLRFDLASGKQIGDPITLDEGAVTSVILSQDNTTLYAAGHSDKITRIDIVGWKPLAPLTLTPDPGPKYFGDVRIALSPDQKRLHLAHKGTRRLETFDAATGSRTVDSQVLGGHPMTPVPSQDGTRLYVPLVDKDAIQIVDAATDKPVGDPVPACGGPAYLALTKDGGRAYVSCSNSNQIAVIDTAKAVRIGDLIGVARDPLGTVLTPDGSKLVVAHGFGHAATFIDIATGTIDGEIVDFPSDDAMVGLTIR
ncbi:hypothetical protein F0L68_24795 [Solihabitans fulvus]|uniref:40-residue YVTN family beta-propeller repeat-containing protein n=1 Tax=Solihabitans fulvus TaxID=1892852 RepID=A0A5B2X2X4_9PSEU|nr:hypothetical protein [Solihabitans fulvus]KAA2257520.1 hypothetical protein F0L68_24795 [Solihabitans fulvus]